MAEKATLWIWGRHSVEACLEESPDLVLEAFVEDGSPHAAIFEGKGLKVQKVPRAPKELADKRHQGVFIKLRRAPVYPLGDLKAELLAQESDCTWAILDGIEDPRNFGAILRSAAAFGVDTVFIPEKSQAPLTGVVAQASAGQMFRLRIVGVPNLGKWLDELNDAAFASAALDASGADLVSGLKKIQSDKIVWVIGAEGKGIHASLMKKCQNLLKIPMDERVESLNASVAASIAFFSTRQKKIMQ